MHRDKVINIYEKEVYDWKSYYKAHFSVDQCTIDGQYMNYDNLLTVIKYLYV